MAADWLTRPYSLKGKRVWVAGHSGMVGQALLRRLESEHCEILIAPRASLELTRQAETERWIAANRPDVVILAAARVGGILANSEEPAAFLYENIMIAANVIHAAAKTGVEKLLFLGSSCIYPRAAAQPISEDTLLSGPLEPTNEAYALAKIAGIKLCQYYRQQHGHDFISAMPCNLYGPGDTYDAQRSHVIPALMMKMHAAKKSDIPPTLWGTGTPRREFLYIDDLAEALVFMLGYYSAAAPLNIGAGSDITIAALALEIAAVVGYRGDIIFDPGKPDGTPRKLMDSSRIFAAGWRPEISLSEGLRRTYESYLGTLEELKNAA